MSTDPEESFPPLTMRRLEESFPLLSRDHKRLRDNQDDEWSVSKIQKTEILSQLDNIQKLILDCQKQINYLTEAVVNNKFLVEFGNTQLENEITAKKNELQQALDTNKILEEKNEQLEKMINKNQPIPEEVISLQRAFSQAFNPQITHIKLQLDKDLAPTSSTYQPAYQS
jgi:hypothetical protein